MFNATLFRSFFANIFFSFSFFISINFYLVPSLQLDFNFFMTTKFSTFFAIYHPFCRPYHFNHSQELFFLIFQGYTFLFNVNNNKNENNKHSNHFYLIWLKTLVGFAPILKKRRKNIHHFWTFMSFKIQSIFYQGKFWKDFQVTTNFLPPRCIW